MFQTFGVMFEVHRSFATVSLSFNMRASASAMGAASVARRDARPLSSNRDRCDIADSTHYHAVTCTVMARTDAVNGGRYRERGHNPGPPPLSGDPQWGLRATARRTQDPRRETRDPGVPGHGCFRHCPRMFRAAKIVKHETQDVES